MAKLPFRKNTKKRTVRRSPNAKANRLGTTSTYRPAKKVKTDRTKRDQKRRWSLKLEGMLVILLATFIGYRLLVLRDSVLIEYDISAPQTLENLDELSIRIGTGVDAELSAQALGRVKPFLPRDDINVFLSSIPEISSWSISTSTLSSKLNLNVDFAEPIALYSVGGQQFYLTEDGRLAGMGSSQIYSVYDQNELIIVQDTQSLLVPEVGDRVLSAVDAQAIKAAVDALDAEGRGAQSVRLTDAPREAQVVIEDSGGLYAKVFLDGDIAGQTASIVEGLDYLEQNDIVPEEFIDVRLVERFIYR